MKNYPFCVMTSVKGACALIKVGTRHWPFNPIRHYNLVRDLTVVPDLLSFPESLSCCWTCT